MAKILDSNPTRIDAKPDQLYPACAYCKNDPLIINCTEFSFPTGLMGIVFFCQNCRATISVQTLGFKPEEPKRIVSPS